MKHLAKFLTIGFTLIGSSALAATVDLSTWATPEGGGTWSIQGSGDAVYQSVNTATPATFFNGVNSQGNQLSGKVKVTGSDDDFIGFVLGYDAGDFSNATADYLLIDWKQGNQNYGPFGGDAKQGLSISRVTGALSSTDAWTHSGNLTELQRATTLGDTGWVTGTEYTFDIIFTASAVQVKVNNQLELSIAGSFEDGSFGFYNFSQAAVTYSSLVEDTAPPISPVPLPATGLLLLAGLGGFGAIRRRKKG